MARLVAAILVLWQRRGLCSRGGGCVQREPDVVQGQHAHSHNQLRWGFLACSCCQMVRDNGYDFLVLSDHNRLTDPEPVMQDLAADSAKPGAKPFVWSAAKRCPTSTSRRREACRFTLVRSARRARSVFRAARA